MIMVELINMVLGLVAVVLVGAFATFFIILNIFSEDIWENIYEYLIGGDKNE